MLKELLKEQQPIVYQALKKAAEEQRISSAYLFSGPYGTPKYEAALLLAQTILCEKQSGLACEECNTCRRVREGMYTDLIVLDGRRETISKDMVDDLQSQFSKTALEKNGQRVYIIRNAENATVSAQSSMLKFLEEPGAGVTAILTTDSINRLLPTILSRCVILPFVPKEAEDYYQEALEAGADKEDAVFLSHIVKDKEDLPFFFDIEKKETTSYYEHAIGMFKEYLNADGMRRNELPVDYETNWASQERDTAKAKQENLIVFQAFFDLLMLYAKNVIEHDVKGPSWYINAVNKEEQRPDKFIKLMKIASEEKDLCSKYNDLNLVMYQTFYRLKELDK